MKLSEFYPFELATQRCALDEIEMPAVCEVRVDASAMAPASRLAMQP
jgi:hypothetical protein